MLAADAQPDKFWSCAGEQFVFKLRPLAEHDPIQEADPMEDVNHKERGHSDLGASATYRWWPCLGSNNLIAALGVQNTPSIYMMQGTAAHELAHLCLLKGQDAIEYIDRRIEEFVVDDEMATAVQVYLDVCRSLVRDDPDLIVLTEKSFTLRSLNPPKPMFGTADFVVIDKKNRTVTVVDFKYGVGWVVDAESNPQLMYYLLGVLCAFSDIQITKLKGIIVQPRARTGKTIKEAEFKPSALAAWSAELIARARLTMDPDAPRQAGPHCQYCPARGRCPTQTEAAYDAAQSEFYAEPLEGEVIPPIRPPSKEVISGVTPQQLGAIYAKFPLLRDFMNAVEEALRAAIENGATDTGYKLIANEGHRQWSDEAAVPALLTSRLGLEEEETLKKTVISPAEAERIATAKLRTMGLKLKEAEPMVKRLLNGITTRPATKPKLVVDTDARAALPPRGSEFEFETLPAPDNK